MTLQCIPLLARKASATVRCQLRREILELRSPAASPARLATAFAIGTLLGFIPLPVLDTLFASLVLVRFKQLNKAALLVARLVWNDLVVLSLAPTGYRLGISILPLTLISPADPTPTGKLIMLAVSVAIGYILMAVAATLVCYVIVWLGMVIFKKRVLGGEGIPLKVEGDQRLHRLRRFLQKDLVCRFLSSGRSSGLGRDKVAEFGCRGAGPGVLLLLAKRFDKFFGRQR